MTGDELNDLANILIYPKSDNKLYAVISKGPNNGLLTVTEKTYTYGQVLTWDRKDAVSAAVTGPNADPKVLYSAQPGNARWFQASDVDGSNNKFQSVYLKSTNPSYDKGVDQVTV